MVRTGLSLQGRHQSGVLDRGNRVRGTLVPRAPPLGFTPRNAGVSRSTRRPKSPGGEAMHQVVLPSGLGDLAPLLLDLTLLLAFAVVVIDLALAAFGKHSEEKVHPRGRRVAP